MEKDYKILKITVMGCLLFLIIYTAFIFDFFQQEDGVGEDSSGTKIILNSTKNDSKFNVIWHDIDSNGNLSINNLLSCPHPRVRIPRQMLNPFWNSKHEQFSLKIILS